MEYRKSDSLSIGGPQESIRECSILSPAACLATLRHTRRSSNGVWPDCVLFFFFFQAEDGIRDYKVTGVQTCALPISRGRAGARFWRCAARRSAIWLHPPWWPFMASGVGRCSWVRTSSHWSPRSRRDRKSTRLNSSHLVISYAVFCLKKKK